MLARILTLLLLAAVAHATVAWWKRAVLYQVYPRSFADSDGDGNGDIRGVIDHVDYFSDIGVTGVWLSPVFMSPWEDNGYDVSNFTDIHPTFGTVQDVKDLIEALHARGIKLLLDFVPNHTSDQHPWFQESKTGEGKYRDFYVWKDPKGFDADGKPIPPNNWRAIIKWTDSTWTYVPERKQFYLRHFLKEQPDLNFTNPEVVEALKDSMRFWLDLGVDGFRVDAVPWLVEDPLWRDEEVREGCPFEKLGTACLIHSRTQNLPATYEIIKEFDRFIREEYEDKYFYLEAYATRDETMKYYQPHTAPFNFFFVRNVTINTNAVSLNSMVEGYMSSLPEDTKYPNWVVGNHDNSRVATKYGPEAVDMINMMATLLPGVAVTYQGEEIGMPDTHLRDDQVTDPQKREVYRTPMQWNRKINSGFSSAKKPWVPVSPNYWQLNVASELNDTNSHLSIYKRLTEYRQHFAGHVNLKTATQGYSIFAFQRKGNDRICYVVNNLNNVGEYVDLSKMFHHLPSNLTVAITSRNSEQTIGDVLSTKEKFYLLPRTGIVLEEVK